MKQFENFNILKNYHWNRILNYFFILKFQSFEMIVLLKYKKKKKKIKKKFTKKKKIFTFIKVFSHLKISTSCKLLLMKQSKEQIYHCIHVKWNCNLFLHFLLQ